MIGEWVRVAVGIVAILAFTADGQRFARSLSCESGFSLGVKVFFNVADDCLPPR